jgi:hypothetical protein
LGSDSVVSQYPSLSKMIALFVVVFRFQQLQKRFRTLDKVGRRSIRLDTVIAMRFNFFSSATDLVRGKVVSWVSNSFQIFGESVQRSVSCQNFTYKKQSRLVSGKTLWLFTLTVISGFDVRIYGRRVVG